MLVHPYSIFMTTAEASWIVSYANDHFV